MNIIFTNEAFSNDKEWQDVTDNSLKLHHNNYFYLRGGHAVLADVQYITIKIFKTSHSCLAAAKLVQIWGKPSRSCNKNILKKLKEIRHEIATTSDTVHDTSFFHTDEVDYNSSNNCAKSNCGNDLNTKSKMKIKNTIQSVTPHKEELIPNDFLDSITCEMMQLPMLLPSGQNIDRTTLDRWIKDLSIRGKDPCDPFTGIAFTETNRPIFNTALKVRLDKYIVDFGNLPSNGRTVGTFPCDSQELNVFRTVRSVVANMNSSRHIDNAKFTITANINAEISKCTDSSKDQIKLSNPTNETIGTKRKFQNYTITSKINMKKTESKNQDDSTDDSAISDSVSNDLQKIRHSLRQAINSKQPPVLQMRDIDIVNKITLCKSKMIRNVSSGITQYIGI